MEVWVIGSTYSVKQKAMATNLNKHKFLGIKNEWQENKNEQTATFLLGKFGESILKSLKELNCSLDREELSHKKQSVITSFFFKAMDLSSEKNVFSYF